MHELGERRRLSFGSVAEQYDRIRPTYPGQLVDDVIAYASDGLTAAGRALEVGAGTEYIELVGTHSDHLLLDAGERRRLFAEIAEVIGAPGGSFELPYGTLLCLARRRP